MLPPNRPPNRSSSDSGTTEGQPPSLLPLYYGDTKRNEPMTRYDVICPSAPWENTTTDQDRAWDLCLSLSEEYGYAQVRCNGVIIGDYTDGM
jgi:hypothetical protein